MISLESWPRHGVRKIAPAISLLMSAAIYAGASQFAVLDLLDSLVRKSLVTVERQGVHARYGMLETIRQFAQERLAADGAGDAVRDRHAAFFAREAQRQWERWDGPDQDTARVSAGFLLSARRQLWSKQRLTG